MKRCFNPLEQFVVLKDFELFWSTKHLFLSLSLMLKNLGIFFLIFSLLIKQGEVKQGVPWTTSVYSVRVVLFEVSSKSVSRKLLSLIKIENCLGGVCLIQCSYYLLFLPNNRSSHQRLILQKRSFDNFSKVLEKICEEVCLLVKLQTVDHNVIKTEFLHRYILRISLKLY